MAHGDRDLNFEKALTRHLCSSAPSPGGSNALAGAPLEACPEPEILAAYHDQSLGLEERNSWKEHVVSCGQCQFVLAQLAATDKIKLEPVPAKDPLLMKERTLFPKNRDRDSRYVNGVRRPPSWRWVLLIPAGAMAATLVAWISLRNGTPSPVPSSSSVQVAQNQPTPVLSSSSKPSAAAPAETKQRAEPASPSAGAAAVAASASREAGSNELAKQSQSSLQATNRRAANAPHGPSVALQKQQQQQVAQEVAGAAGTFDQKKSPARAPSKISEYSSPAVAAPPPPPPPSEPSFLDGGALAASSAGKTSPAPPATASNVAVAKDKSANADAVSPMSETVEVSAEPRTREQAKAMLRSAALQNPHVFVAPDGKHLWRIGPAGSLERSKDEGIKWTLQTSGVNADLAAGSAPSARVAWIVGNSGTILRTTDGGAHWTKVNSPVTNDLTGIRAADAFHATIWFVADPQTGATTTYETMDGGATWSPIPPK